MTKKDHKEIARLEKALREWRATNSCPTPIPGSIWSGAAQLAEGLGVGPVAKKLRLDHAKLKRLTKELTAEPCSDSLATFVEFRPGQVARQASSVSCAIEVVSPSGGVLRARLDGLSASELGTVFRTYGN